MNRNKSHDDNNDDNNHNNNNKDDEQHRSVKYQKLKHSMIPKVKSLDCRIQVKMIIHNQSGRKVEINWIDYSGNEYLYFALGPSCKYVIDTFVTHPWIFRDVKRRNLAMFDAFIADRKDLIILTKRNLYNKQKCFQVNSRIFFPRQHKIPENFILVIVKNGVYSLQEICMNSIIDRLNEMRTTKNNNHNLNHNNNHQQQHLDKTNDQITKNFIQTIPIHLRDTFKRYLAGQNIIEFYNEYNS